MSLGVCWRFRQSSRPNKLVSFPQRRPAIATPDGEQRAPPLGPRRNAPSTVPWRSSRGTKCVALGSYSLPLCRPASTRRRALQYSQLGIRAIGRWELRRQAWVWNCGCTLTLPYDAGSASASNCGLDGRAFFVAAELAQQSVKYAY